MRVRVKNVVNLKGCPRCSGDLYIADDMYGTYAECLQCGYMRDLDKDSDLAIEVLGVKESVA